MNWGTVGRRAKRGNILFVVLVLGGLAAFLIGGLVQLGVSEYRAGQTKTAKEIAFNLAEAGVEYYKWHLAHDPNDFQDGTGQPGPYVRTYTDKNGIVIGSFSLDITPPPVGSSIAQIRSTGWSVAAPFVRQSVVVRVGRPSLAEYAFVTNANAFVPAGAFHGKLHANGGLRFDGTADAAITSAKDTYVCEPADGCDPSEVKPGIWSAAGAPTTFWQFPAASVDFGAIAADLASLKSLAQTDGLYLASSGANGYLLQFNPDGTFSIFTVTVLQPPVVGTDVNGIVHTDSNDIQSTTFVETRALPASGIVFVEDHVWVEGTVSGLVTIGSGRFPDNPATRSNIVINRDITYVRKDGSAALGLVAQQNILIPYLSPVDLEIDAAMVAINGSVQRYLYAGDIKNRLSIYGSVISYGKWMWTWMSGGGGPVVSGYSSSDTAYDAHLASVPPPGFPLKSSSYQLISWQEE
ncbi:hypothetical protein HYZ80_00405 [Candidatus Parcubacteria bacterium]|nr:hypothetical protein [Candidatus Parcubacteria bacterium]